MCHVLVIEDEPFVAMTIEDTLLASGASSVDIAATEIDAINAAQRHPPAFITSDVRLLQGTGPTAVAAIRRRHGNIPVVFITGTPEECQPCTFASAVLAKPIDHCRMKAVLRTLIEAAA